MILRHGSCPLITLRKRTLLSVWIGVIGLFLRADSRFLPVPGSGRRLGVGAQLSDVLGEWAVAAERIRVFTEVVHDL